MNEPKGSRWVAIYAAFLAAKIQSKAATYTNAQLEQAMQEARELADAEEEVRRAFEKANTL